MTRKQLEKIRKQYEELDYSRWHILGYDELLKINGGSSASSDDDESDEEEGFSAEDESSKTNDAETASESGGHEIENTVEAVANAEVGDTLTREDGTQVTITQGDIDWAQEHCDSGKDKDDEETSESKSGEDVTEAMPPEEESASSDSMQDGEESSTPQNQRESAEEKESSAFGENKNLDDDKTDSKETAGTSKSENSAAENETKQSSASSGKESSSTPAETTRSAESAPQSASRASSASEPEEKSSHGFWSSLVDKVSDVFSAAKDWVCDAFGIGEDEKKGVDSVLSLDERIRNSINLHWGESYKKSINDCDIWLENVLKDAGRDISAKWGDAHINDVKAHESKLADELQQKPTGSWNVVLMTEERHAHNPSWQDHTGLLETHANGSVTFYENTSSKNGPTSTDYPSVESFESDYGYKDFDYYEVK